MPRTELPAAPGRHRTVTVTASEPECPQAGPGSGQCQGPALRVDPAGLTDAGSAGRRVHQLPRGVQCRAAMAALAPGPPAAAARPAAGGRGRRRARSEFKIKFNLPVLVGRESVGDSVTVTNRRTVTRHGDPASQADSKMDRAQAWTRRFRACQYHGESPAGHTQWNFKAGTCHESPGPFWRRAGVALNLIIFFHEFRVLLRFSYFKSDLESLCDSKSHFNR